MSNKKCVMAEERTIKDVEECYFLCNEVIIQMKRNSLVEFDGVTLEQLEAELAHLDFILTSYKMERNQE